MKAYNRPVVLVHEELSEGVYTASGEMTVSFEVTNGWNGRQLKVTSGVEIGETIQVIYTDGTVEEHVYRGYSIGLQSAGCGNSKTVDKVVVVEKEEDNDSSCGNGGWKPPYWGWGGHWGC